MTPPNKSVKRQLRRGEEARAHNQKVRETGKGYLIEERTTDFSLEAAKARYSIFQYHYETLVSLGKHFTFKLIDAGRPLEHVRKDLSLGFQFQSSLELAEETFNAVSSLPLVSELKRHARQELIRRLDNYQSRSSQLFAQVIHVLRSEFVPFLRMHVDSGFAVIRTENL